MKKFTISIDGPASSGKSTTAKKLAQKLCCVYIDSGAMYRAVALFLLENNVHFEDEQSITDILSKVSIEIKNKINKNGNIIFLNGKDVSQKIRNPEITKYSSIVARIAVVRKKMVELQRNIAQKKSIVMEGRDIGTVVFPDAAYKFYLIASIEERAKRRWLELVEKGERKTLDEVKQEIKWRDKSDSSRKIAPLCKPEDAIEIDTSNLTIDEQVEKIYKYIKL